MKEPQITSCTAFADTRRIATGDLRTVAVAAKAVLDRDRWVPVLIFDDVTGNLVEVDYRGSVKDVVQRIDEAAANQKVSAKEAETDDEKRGPGRPKLGVVAREITLLPRHWDWLANQPGGASVALRKLVDQARQVNQSKDSIRRSQEAAYRFLSAMAGNEPYFEDATRALFAGNRERFAEIVERWPVDIRDYAMKLTISVFAE